MIACGLKGIQDWALIVLGPNLTGVAVDDMMHVTGRYPLPPARVVDARHETRVQQPVQLGANTSRSTWRAATESRAS